MQRFKSCFTILSSIFFNISTSHRFENYWIIYDLNTRRFTAENVFRRNEANAFLRRNKTAFEPTIYHNEKSIYLWLKFLFTRMYTHPRKVTLTVNLYIKSHVISFDTVSLCVYNSRKIFFYTEKNLQSDLNWYYTFSALGPNLILAKRQSTITFSHG